MAEKQKSCCTPKATGAGAGTVYGLGFLGAAWYYLQGAVNFQTGVMGIVKAIIWPVLVVYKLHGWLGM